MRRHADNWMARAFFGMHYDLHATAVDTQLGAELTHDHLRERLKTVKPDFIQCDCKGHPGFSSYPTKVGYAAPGIVRDALRIHREVTRELGLPLLVHYSGLWDDQAIQHHPDWGMRNADGSLVNPWFDQRPGGGVACLTGPYDDRLLIPQLLEIVREYDVDGFWIDGENWAVRDCYCDRCRKEFARRTGMTAAPTGTDDPHFPAWRAFQRDLFVQHVRRYTAAIHAVKPDCLVCSNWMYSMRQPGPVAVPVDFLSGDFMASFGCERAQMEGRYLAGHGMPWNLMAWGFCSPVEGEVPRQTKTVTGLCQEAAEVMSCGGGMLIYADPQRSGWLNDWQHRIFADVVTFCRDRQPFCQHTESIPEAVVLHGDSHAWKHNPQPFAMGEGFYHSEGALHVLMENHYHVDILDETRLIERINRYRLVVIGEQQPTAPAVLAAVEAYARAGGIVLLTGSHLAGDCGGLVGVKPAEPVRNEPWYMAVDGETAIMGGPWQPVTPVDSETYAFAMTGQQPGKDETPYPAVTIRNLGTGKIAAIHGTIMRSYYLTHQPRIRTFVRQLLEHLKVERRVVFSGPPSVEVAVRRQGDKTLIHLVNRAVNPTLTPHLHLVEDVPPSGLVRVELRREHRPRRVCLQPGHRDVAWSYELGVVKAEIATVHIHDILEIE